MSGMAISRVHARRVWDSRGRPAVEAEITLAGGAIGRAIAPAGASRGAREAVDLRDGGTRFGGFGVERAIANVEGPIAKALAGMDAGDQSAADAVLIEVDGTPDKSRLGGNAIVAVRWRSHKQRRQRPAFPCGVISQAMGRSRCRCPKSRFSAAERTRRARSTCRT